MESEFMTSLSVVVVSQLLEVFRRLMPVLRFLSLSTKLLARALESEFMTSLSLVVVSPLLEVFWRLTPVLWFLILSTTLRFHSFRTTVLPWAMESDFTTTDSVVVLWCINMSVLILLIWFDSGGEVIFVDDTSVRCSSSDMVAEGRKNELSK